MSFARPLMIVTEDKPVRLPEPIDDSRLDEEMGKWHAQPRDLPSLLESYIQTIKLYDILKQVLDREELKDSRGLPRYSTSPESGYDYYGVARFPDCLP